MNNRIFILLSLLALLVLLLLIRSCGGGEKAVEAEISMRYLVCTNCNAQYEIPADYFVKVDESNLERGDNEATFRCRECGEIAALPGMIVEMNGKIVRVSGAQYDEK